MEQRIDYKNILNPQQFAAVTAPPGPSLVLAGAGSGKTRVLTYRVLYLLEQGIPADKILLLTFTNKAAREMMGRVTELLGHDLPELWGGTFHSVGQRILRRHAELLGYQSRFTILDREDSEQLINHCAAELVPDRKAEKFPKSEVLSSVLSLSINTQRPMEEIIHNQHEKLEPFVDKIKKVTQLYQERKLASNVMDFDDLLALWLRLLEENPSVLDRYQRQFQFVLVDEYQDTNLVQGKIVDLLVAKHKNLTVVGDDAQSIYSWRGAHYKNILSFPERYVGAAVHKIETNYRSTPEILDVANQAISQSNSQFFKNLMAFKQPGLKPMLIKCLDTYQQSDFIARQAAELRDQGVPLSSMAVLYRSHFHAMELQMSLASNHVPFSITSGLPFFQQAHLKDIAAYLKLLCNPRDELSFKRIVQLIPGIGAKAAEKLWILFNSHAQVEELTPVTHSLPVSDNDGGTATLTPFPKFSLLACKNSVPKKAQAQWDKLFALMEDLSEVVFKVNPPELVKRILESGYEEYLELSYENARNRLEDIQRFGEFGRQFLFLPDFLAHIALMTDQETSNYDPTEDRIRLSTIHQAKGLEFDVVFVIMLLDGFFPSSRSLENSENLEEERRLFYVSVTRARERLFLTYPMRVTFRGGDGAPPIRSRFLNGFSKKTLETLDLTDGASAQVEPF